MFQRESTIDSARFARRKRTFSPHATADRCVDTRGEALPASGVPRREALPQTPGRQRTLRDDTARVPPELFVN